MPSAEGGTEGAGTSMRCGFSSQMAALITLDNHLVSLAARNHNLALVLEHADDGDNLLLCLLHVADLDRAHELDLLAQHICRTRRHILVDFLCNFLRRRLECEGEILGLDLAQNKLQRIERNMVPRQSKLAAQRHREHPQQVK